MEKNLFDILKERGYIKDLTHEKEIIELINGKPMTFYLGIDPTADSLHIGHFFALTLFRWLQDFGHHGIILIGGATALIGDPTGKSDMRKILSKDEVKHNKEEVKELVKRFVKTDENGRPLSVAFSETEAYSILFMELATDDAKAAEFVNGIIPSDLKEQDGGNLKVLSENKSE